MRKLLTLLLLFVWMGSEAQTGSKPDFLRTPNGPFTIVDYNFKAKTLNLPHYLLTARRPSQDSIGTIFLNTNSADPHIYIKNLVGSTYNPLAFISDVHNNTFTNDFKIISTLVGFADTLHRTSLPWIINNTSTTQPSLVVNSNNSTGNTIQVWNYQGSFAAQVTGDGYYRGAGIYSQSGLANGFIALSPNGTVVGRNTADGISAFKIQQSSFSSTGDLIDIQNPAKTVWSLGIGGNVVQYSTKTALSGSAVAHNIVGFVKPSANGDALWGLKIAPILGSSTIASWGTLVGGTGYPNSATTSILTGGTGIGAVATITVSGGIIQTATIAESGTNYTVGDILSIVVIDPVSGMPVGSGGTVTVATVTTYTGVVSTMLEVDGGLTKLAPSTSAYPSLIIPTGSAFTGSQTGAMWSTGTHLFAQLGGVNYQLDQQLGVNSIFGRNGNVVAQSGDYNTSQVTENTNLYFTNARVLTAPITGFVSQTGALLATDPVLVAIEKLNGNIAASVTGVSSFNTRGGAVIPVAGDYASLTETLTNKDVTSGTNIFPTFNQNTTGSAATLTTPRTINTVSFNGSANITITANTPGTLTNGFALLGSPFSGANQTWKVDTTKVATQWKIDSTTNAHGASAGYGINSTLFTAGTVAVDTTNVASKVWGLSAFYTKNQILTNNFTFTGIHTHVQNSIASTPTDALLVGNNTLSLVGAQTQLSGAINFFSHAWNTTSVSDNINNMRMYAVPIPGTSTFSRLVIDESINGGAYANVWSVNSFGQMAVGQTTTSGLTTSQTYVSRPSSPTVVNTTATLTAAQVNTQALTSTTAAAVTATLPSANSILTNVNGVVGSTERLLVINTGPNSFTIALPGTITSASTITGGTNLVVAAGVTAVYEIVWPTTTSAEIYRLK